MIYKGVLGLIDRLRAYAERATDAAVKIRNAGLANTIEALVQKLNDRLGAVGGLAAVAWAFAPDRKRRP
jgi:hypothetical protein